MKKVYILMHGVYGKKGYINKIFELKKDAVKYIKSQKFKYVKRKYLYENDEIRKWYRVDCHSIIIKKRRDKND